MAATKVRSVKTNLARVINYATNPKKTEQQFYTAGINCDIHTAYSDMLLTKKVWGKEGGILAFHAFQSFKPGEATPEQAHKIGMEFARQMWGDRFQVVIGTHLDRGHLHNHFVVNSVSFMDGKRYLSQKKTYYGGVRKISDELCREHGLSVVEHPKNKDKPYREYMDEKAGKPTQNAFIKADIDASIEKSYTFQSFVDALKRKGYTVKYGPNVKHMTVKPPGAERARRLDTLGDPRYTEDAIRARLARHRAGEPEPEQPAPAAKPPRRYRAPGPIPKPRRKLTGFMALYFKYLYLLGAIRRRKAPGRIPYGVRPDAMKLEKYRRQFLFLYQNGIESTAQLDQYQAAAEAKTEAIREARAPLYTERRNATDEGEKAAISEQIAAAGGDLRELRKDITMCKRIRDTAPAVEDSTRTIEAERARQEPGKERREQEKRPERKRPSL